MLRISTNGMQADRIGRERRAAALRIGGGELAAHEQRAHDQIGHQQERDQARASRAAASTRSRGSARCARPRSSPAAMPPRHLRQQHGADRDADHADRQLIEAVGVVERRERAGGEKARDDGVGEQRELHAGRADRRRPERAEEAASRPRRAAASGAPAARRRASASPPTSSTSSTPAISTPQAAAWPGGRERTRPAPASPSSRD